MKAIIAGAITFLVVFSGVSVLLASISQAAGRRSWDD